MDTLFFGGMNVPSDPRSSADWERVYLSHPVFGPILAADIFWRKFFMGMFFPA